MSRPARWIWGGRRAGFPEHGHRWFRQPGDRQYIARPEESPGGAAYLFTGLSRFAQLSAAYGELQGPGFHWHGQLLALGIGNGRQAGGGHELCPGALIDDGLLDVSILPAPQELVGALKSLLAGDMGIDDLFIRARLPWVEIKASRGLDINLDGEPRQGELLRFTARPAALQMHLPQGSPLLGTDG